MHDTIGFRLKVARESMGLKQADLAERAGTQWQQVSRWERGTATPRAKAVKALSEALKINPTWLLTGEGPMLPPLFKNEAELEAYITGAAPGPGLAGTPKVYDPACGSGAFPALLTKALAAALSQNPTPTPEAAAKAAVEATITAQRTQKEDRIEDLVKILLS